MESINDEILHKNYIQNKMPEENKKLKSELKKIQEINEKLSEEKNKFEKNKNDLQEENEKLKEKLQILEENHKKLEEKLKNFQELLEKNNNNNSFFSNSSFRNLEEKLEKEITARILLQQKIQELSSYSTKKSPFFHQNFFIQLFIFLLFFIFFIHLSWDDYLQTNYS